MAERELTINISRKRLLEVGKDRIGFYLMQIEVQDVLRSLANEGVLPENIECNVHLIDTLDRNSNAKVVVEGQVYLIIPNKLFDLN